MIMGLNNRSAGIKALILLFASLLVTGCVTTEETNRMQWELNELRADVKNIKQQSKSIETKFPGQNEKVRELEETQRASARATADLLIRVQDLMTEVQMITGRFEEARYNSEKNAAEFQENKEMLIAKMKQLETKLEDLEKKLAEPPPTPAPKEEPKKSVPEVKEKEAEKKEEAVEPEDGAGKEVKDADNGKAARDSGPAEEGKLDVKDAYMEAYGAYKEDRTVEAREKFKALLMDYSENEYSDNARFWIAESYYKDGNYEDAILAYEELFRKNPDSDKAPGAMLKQGLAFYALKDKDTGRIILEKLVDKFPESDQAKLAAKKMKKVTVPPKNK